MTEPTRSTIKRLFAHSGNRCAFPQCSLPIVEDSGFPTGTVCHIRARSAGGPRYDPKQTDDERHAYENLILLCARHSKLIDSDPTAYSAEVLDQMKTAHEEKNGSIELGQSDALKADALLNECRAVYNITAGGHVMLNSAGAVQATNVTIRSTKASLKSLPAQGSLGSSVVHRNYVKHLIDRYNDFACRQTGREFSHAVIYSSVKRRFKADWERTPLVQFDALVEFLHNRIDTTQLGKINRSKGVKNYSTFEAYRVPCAGDTSGLR